MGCAGSKGTATVAQNASTSPAKNGTTATKPAKEPASKPAPKPSKPAEETKPETVTEPAPEAQPAPSTGEPEQEKPKESEPETAAAPEPDKPAEQEPEKPAEAVVDEKPIEDAPAKSEPPSNDDGQTNGVGEVSEEQQNTHETEEPAEVTPTKQDSPSRPVPEATPKAEQQVTAQVEHEKPSEEDVTERPQDTEEPTAATDPPPVVPESQVDSESNEGEALKESALPSSEVTTQNGETNSVENAESVSEAGAKNDAPAVSEQITDIAEPADSRSDEPHGSDNSCDENFTSKTEISSDVKQISEEKKVDTELDVLPSESTHENSGSESPTETHDVQSNSPAEIEKPVQVENDVKDITPDGNGYNAEGGEKSCDSSEQNASPMHISETSDDTTNVHNVEDTDDDSKTEPTENEDHTATVDAVETNAGATATLPESDITSEASDTVTEPLEGSSVVEKDLELDEGGGDSTTHTQKDDGTSSENENTDQTHCAAIDPPVLPEVETPTDTALESEDPEECDVVDNNVQEGNGEILSEVNEPQDPDQSPPEVEVEPSTITEPGLILEANEAETVDESDSRTSVESKDLEVLPSSEVKESDHTILESTDPVEIGSDPSPTIASDEIPNDDLTQKDDIEGTNSNSDSPEVEDDVECTEASDEPETGCCHEANVESGSDDEVFEKVPTEIVSPVGGEVDEEGDIDSPPSVGESSSNADLEDGNGEGDVAIKDNDNAQDLEISNNQGTDDGGTDEYTEEVGISNAGPAISIEDDNGSNANDCDDSEEPPKAPTPEPAPAEEPPKEEASAPAEPTPAAETEQAAEPAQTEDAPAAQPAESSGDTAADAGGDGGAADGGAAAE